MAARWCKKCKVVFHDATCPAGHANFMYTTKVPAAVSGTPADTPAPQVAAPQVVAPQVVAPQVVAPQVHRLRQASGAERLQTEAALAVARELREEEAALDAELSRVKDETKKHWDVQTGGGLWGKAGGGFATRDTGQARALEGVTSRGVAAGTQVAEAHHDFYQPLHRTMLAGGKTKDTWTFGLWPPNSDDAPGQAVEGRVVTFHEHHVVQQGKARGYLRNHKTAEQAREYLAVVLEVTECESRPALEKMLGLPQDLPAGQYEFWADKGAARDLMNGDLVRCYTLGGTVCIGTSLQLLERAQKPEKRDVVLAIDPMRRGRVYESEAKDVRHAYSALGTIRDEEAMDSSVLDGSTGFIDQMSAQASQQRAAHEAEGRRRQASAAFDASAGDCVDDDEWDD